MNNRVSFIKSIEDGTIDLVVGGRRYALNESKLPTIIDYLQKGLDEIRARKKTLKVVKDVLGDEQ